MRAPLPLDPKKDQALVVLAFFFLLRAGKYMPFGNQITRTNQIRRKDLQFWRKRPDDIVVSNSPPW